MNFYLMITNALTNCFISVIMNKIENIFGISRQICFFSNENICTNKILYKSIAMLKVCLIVKTMQINKKKTLTRSTKVPKTSPIICRASSFFTFILLITFFIRLIFSIGFYVLCKTCCPTLWRRSSDFSLCLLAQLTFKPCFKCTCWVQTSHIKQSTSTS